MELILYAFAGIAGLSAYEGNLILTGLSGILGAFLAIQVIPRDFR
jgi:hypothetical protein